MSTEGYTRVSPGVYRKPNGSLTYIPSNNIAISAPGAKKNDTSRTKQIKGSEVSIREAVANGQVVYGEFRIGGVYTFIETSKDSKAYLRTGEANHQIVWQARAAGPDGNQIHVTIECFGTQGAISVNVTGNEIVVRVRSTSGVSQSTASQVIAAVKANAPANALVTVHAGEGDGTGNVQAFSRTSLAGGGGTWLHQVITLACHEIDSIQALYLDNRQVTFGHPQDSRWAVGDFLSRVFMATNFGGDNQGAILDLQGQVGADVWSNEHRQRGCAHVYLICVWNASLFANGLPEVSFLVRGKKCYDFRTSQTVWTQNAALIIADYLTSTKYGMGVPLADLDTANWIEAANTCDELVTLAGGGTEKRYSINGVLDTNETPQQVLEDMLQAISGNLVYQGGKWFLYPGKYRAPTKTITESDIRDEILVTTLIPRKDRFNAVKGTHVNPANDYTEGEYGVIQNAGYAAQDGGVIWGNIPQEYCTSVAQCQRVAKIELEKIRQGVQVEAVLGSKFLDLKICEVVQVNLPRFGWSNKTFEVRELSILNSTENGVVVKVRMFETAAGIYNWSAEETAVDLAPNTNLPNPLTVLAPTNLVLSSGTNELYLRTDGTVFSRIKVSWTLPEDEFVTEGGKYEIQYRKTGSSQWQALSDIPGENSFTYILDVEDSQRYDVRIRSVNAINVASSWVEQTNYLVLGKTQKPANVTGFTGVSDAFGIELQWQRVPDLDVKEYEVRLGSTWGTATQITSVRGTRYRVELKTAGSYNFLIKAIDTSGNYSDTATSTNVVISGPGAPIVSSTFSGPDLIINWQPPQSNFSIDSYEIRYGAVFSSATVVAEVKGTAQRMRVDWGGTRTYWVVARDVAGNQGTPAPLAVVVLNPVPATDVSVEPLDNNALIRWKEPQKTTLPIAKYELSKGADYSTSLSLGEIAGTFASQYELLAGTYTYWLVTIDSAGNRSAPVSVTIKLDQPPDFIFIGDALLDSSNVIATSNVLIDGEQYINTNVQGQPIGLGLLITYA